MLIFHAAPRAIHFKKKRHTPQQLTPPPSFQHKSLPLPCETINNPGDRAWIISQKDASIRNFGFLVSRKKLVYTVDDDCRPATGPDGKVGNKRGGV